MKDILDEQEFDDLMHTYRIVPITHQPEVIRAFEEVKFFLRKAFPIHDYKSILDKLYNLNQENRDLIAEEFGVTHKGYPPEGMK